MLPVPAAHALQVRGASLDARRGISWTQATSRAFFRAVTPFGWTQSVKVLLHAKGVIDSPLMRAPAANLTPARRAELEATCAALAAADGSGLLGGLAVRKS